MYFALYLIIVLILALIFSRYRTSSNFKNEVKILFAQSQITSKPPFSFTQLVGLPEPVQRYFRHVLQEGQVHISYARIKHKGLFKTGMKKKWIHIVGEQYATTEKPGFIWQGTTALFVAKDMYLSNRGKLIVSLLSVFKLVNAKGKHYDSGELLRWLGESILYPTNFLPSERLTWFSIDENTAQLTFNYNGLALFFKVRFNEIGEIIEMETKRYMNENELQTWVIKSSEYKIFNKVCIPTSFDVLWRLAECDFSYAKFVITEVEYDIPKQF